MTHGHAKPYYDAEFTLRFALENGGTYNLFGSTITLPIEARFSSVDDVVRYLHKVYEHLDFDDLPPAVRERKGQAMAHYEPLNNTIAVPVLDNWALREVVVLHELAHHLGRDGHGPEWAGWLLDLLEHCVGPEAAWILQVEFLERGVPFRRHLIQ